MRGITVTIELGSMLEAEALESALDIFVECESTRAEDAAKVKDPHYTARDRARLAAGRALLERIRG